MIRHLGDRGLLVELGRGIDPAVNRRVKQLHRIIARERPHGVVETVPAYASLLVVFDPLQASPEALKRQIIGLCDFEDAGPTEDRAVVEIPVVYGGEAGPDLDAVAAHHGLSREAVIGLHTGTVYRVYMIGFTPGFPYMGELPEALDTPRRDTPRTHIPKGSVAIAQRQTGIYPAVSPGGWQIIGRTPVALFDPRKETPSFLTMGDAVRFTPITGEEAAQWPL
ncbi:MAG: 5-oxoprolinase subunit PxpB [Desulfobacteraceae bacterium]|nr:5-oxoprolinase subunit PxpB [Desulfobacteraceae bacterium]MBC2751171.1 5-oxoprolinase subunit PxpB [Desulfobacteraceae bacterium]